jgi:uncharacterized membrane protein YphA (DoxX/SURF4 family)
MANLLITFLITIMYFLAGLNKVKTFAGVSADFQTKLNFLTGMLTGETLTILAKLIILMVIILEIGAPLIIMFQTFSANNGMEYFRSLRFLAKLSALVLAAFTVLATILYHMPVEGKNYYPFMSNVTATGALLLLAKSI